MTIFKKLGWYFKEQWKHYTIAVASLLIVSLINLIPPKILGAVVDMIAENKLEKTELYKNISLIVIIAILLYVLRYVWRLKLFGSAKNLERILRYRLFSHFIKMSPSFYQKNRIGDLMAHSTNDTSAVALTAGGGILAGVDSIMTGTFVLLAMFFGISWKLTLLVIIPMPFLIFTTNRLGKMIHKQFKNAQEQFSHLNDHTQESISGIKVMRTFGYENEEVESYKKITEKTFLSNFKASKIDSLFDIAVVIFLTIANIIALGCGGYFVNKNIITIGELLSFMTYLEMLVWPMLATGWFFNVVQRGMASYDRIEKILKVENDIKDSSSAISDIKNGKIEYCVEEFKYNDTAVVKDIKFSLEKGHTLGIVGKTGSGKTTLLRLLMREFDVEKSKGYINIDTYNVKDYKVTSLRSLMGYVPQEQFLFSITIAENIAFGNPESTKEEIKEAARLADVEKDINDMIDGYDTLVGEHGVSLSGGQKQRIAIARALILNPDILILDDSLSAVDARTEESILNNVRETRQGKTNIITAHRLSAIKHADLILVLENGEIVERGNHSQLLENKSWYYRTYQKQQIAQSMEEEK